MCLCYRLSCHDVLMCCEMPCFQCVFLRFECVHVWCCCLNCSRNFCVLWCVRVWLFCFIYGDCCCMCSCVYCWFICACSCLLVLRMFYLFYVVRLCLHFPCVQVRCYVVAVVLLVKLSNYVIMLLVMCVTVSCYLLSMIAHVLFIS